MQTEEVINTRRIRRRLRFMGQRTFIAVFIIGLITIVFLPLFPLYISGSFSGDVVHQYIPFKATAKVIWHSGEFPLWNPYVFSGAPLFADPQNSLLYPSQVLFLILDLNIAFVLSLYVHLVFLVAGSYLLLRIWCDRISSMFVALTFGLSGPVFFRVAGGIISTLQVLAWIPWIFYFLEMHRKKQKTIWAVAAGIALGMQILGGFPTLSFYTMLSIVSYMVFVILDNIRQKQTNLALKNAKHWIIATLCAFSLSSVQIFPTIEFLSLTGRSFPPYAFVKSGSLPPFNLITILLPEIFGSALTGTAIQGANWWEQNLYIGVMPVILVFIYLFSFWRVSGLEIKLYLTMLLICLFVAFGVYNPLYIPLYSYVPFFRAIADNGRISMLLAFFLAILGALSLVRLAIELPKLSSNSRRILLAIMGVCITLLIVALSILIFGREKLTELAKPIIVQSYGSLSDEKIKELPKLYQTQIMTVLNCLFVFVIGGSIVYARMISKISARQFILACGVLMTIDAGIFATRIVDANTRNSAHKMSTEHISVLFYQDRKSRFLPLNAMEFTNKGSLYQIPTITGYNPLIISSYRRLLGVIGGKTVDPADRVPMVTNYTSPLLPLLNVGYIISDHPLNDQRLTLLDSRGAYLYRLPVNPQQARMYYNVEYLPDDEQIAHRLADPSFDPMHTLIIKGAHSSVASTANSTPVWKVDLVRSSSLRVEFDVYTTDPGWLLVGDTYYPGWKATVNGRKVMISQANLALRAIEIPQGRHTVVFSYEPDSFRFGMFVSLASVLILFCLFGYKLLVVRPSILVGLNESGRPEQQQ
jgi:hypothetical protein